MSAKRKSIPVDVRRLVLHESGYQCANPNCRTILTLDMHHIEYVVEGGSDKAENLVPLCPNCHTRHHQRHIPKESIRAWKMLLLALNEGFDRYSLNVLLALAKVAGGITVSGDGVLRCAGLVASGLVDIAYFMKADFFPPREHIAYTLQLTNKGRLVVEGWKRGDQGAVIAAFDQADSDSRD